MLGKCLVRQTFRSWSGYSHLRRRFCTDNTRMVIPMNCLVLHPVMRPNKGPELELNFAEEAIGLAKSLGWNVVPGPGWKQEYTDKIQEEYGSEEEQLSEETYGSDYDSDGYVKPERANKVFKNGDYVYTATAQGVFWEDGIITDPHEEEFDLYDEWKNKLVRDSMAKSILINVKKVSSSLFFTRGKLNDLGQYIKSQDVEVVYVNTMLTPIQQKKLEKRFNDFLQDREERLRRYYIRSANKSVNEPTDIDSDSGYVTGEPERVNENETIRVIDRFGIILMIFANRARSNISKLQIELAWLDYARLNLSRGSGPTFGRIGHLFKEDLSLNESTEVEIKSYRGRGHSGTGAVQGGGEKQIELERRKINDRKAEIKRKIAKAFQGRTDSRMSRQKRTKNIPLIALVGYTNVGKTTLMNRMTSESLGVEDQLFHTLTTTVRKCYLTGNQKADLIDTIGFISHLPHTLVDSFKSTLEEILYADILIHVRDISHPSTDFQKETVLRILEEIGTSPKLMNEGYIEVWNKLDLLSDEQIENEIFPKLENTEYPIIPMSALNDPNRDELIGNLTEKINQIYGLRKYQLEYHFSEHDKRREWLLKYANVPDLHNFEYKGDNICVTVHIDDVVYQQYMKTFERQKFDQMRQGQSKLKAPEGW
ncbi:unnamed protein product [Moneuplotes crassus]|uniref:Hflx-type G domain-containing protein n=1 Tax=Euplotes crassus TaxID=5936 RepID=A0AAD1U6H3_EUPCR|nr:unnamed protein product [Moneuplotes crassus]